MLPGAFLEHKTADKNLSHCRLFMLRAAIRDGSINRDEVEA